VVIAALRHKAGLAADPGVLQRRLLIMAIDFKSFDEAIKLAGDMREVRRRLKVGKDTQEYIEAVGPSRVDGWCAAAKRGSTEGQLLFGFCLAVGAGVGRNDAVGLQWLRCAAEKGSAEAQTILGWMHLKGSRVAQNFTEAVRLFRMAATQGIAEAQNYLGCMYYEGWGVAQNYTEAARLFQAAADQGHVGALREATKVQQQRQPHSSRSTARGRCEDLGGGTGIEIAEFNLRHFYDDPFKHPHRF
jgi:hypothetical protein